ncbi:EVE domain-containing protein [Hyalangium versicolor]|uniref:EVE domain-containing protein n=1 Tax=Hyalangium versicolor TaxID=2861190 RepID=UPI001CCF0181|nr:EVE domain-containing protein [Hyalangium versicolor]
MAKTQYWLIKSEPTVYPYSQLEKERKTGWTGIRNYEARNNLRAMKPGDLCLYYHSNEGKAVVAVAKVLSAATPDPTAPGEDWASVEVGPVVPLQEPVELSTIKKTAALKDIQLITRSRISVVPVSAPHFKLILKLGKTALPR